MQDLKTGHLLGAAPNAQFWGQVIGATVGAVVSAFIYKLYTAYVKTLKSGPEPANQPCSILSQRLTATLSHRRVYQIPGELFQVPTAYVWIFTARLVTGKGLPPAVPQWALGAGILFAISTIVRIGSVNQRWRCFVPGGIAVAVGMHIVQWSYQVGRSQQQACTMFHHSL